jgi:hypothetical protein
VKDDLRKLEALPTTIAKKAAQERGTARQKRAPKIPAKVSREKDLEELMPLRELMPHHTRIRSLGGERARK